MIIKFRLFIANVLRKLIRLVDIPPTDEIVTFVTDLVLASDKLRASGEYKRHKVYSSTIKKFPGVPRKSIALLIEEVVRDTL